MSILDILILAVVANLFYDLGKLFGAYLRRLQDNE